MVLKLAKRNSSVWDFEVKHINDLNSEALVPCYCCKKVQWVGFPRSEYKEDLQHTLLTGYVCPVCRLNGENKKNEAEKAEIKQNQRIEAEKAYEKNLIESQLAQNHLAWDPTHKGANNELFAWVQKCQLENMLLTGDTGLCKTRILQYFGGMEIKAGRSVFYSPASLMLNKLSSAYSSSCAEGDVMLEKIFCFDLLIIDDLGKEIGSNSQVGRLWDIIDRRYIRDDQEKDIREGKILPLYAKNLNRSHGWKLWISTNLGIDDIFNKYEKNFNRAGDPLLNRLNSMCKVWEAPENKGLGI